ncbi:chromate transporter [Phenylobacterium immobile]|uniref:chromate transporter n=1 Tax=Phenylobacterium immobile TaxID=21 RepID=UPI000ADD42E8|nr:chromate transporter [Phenylobacterium immobile]
MSARDLVSLTTTFAALSVGAVGGANAVTPEIQRIAVDQQHWMDQATFSQLFAIANTAPGPNVLLVSMVGWQVAGVAGLLVATLAILIPSSLLALVANRLITRYDSLTIVRAIRTGLAPIAVGLLMASGLVLSRGANPTIWAWIIGLAAMAFVLTLKRNPAWALLVAAILGAFAGPFIYPA